MYIYIYLRFSEPALREALGVVNAFLWSHIFMSGHSTFCLFWFTQLNQYLNQGRGHSARLTNRLRYAGPGSGHTGQRRMRGSAGCSKNKFSSAARVSHNTRFTRHLSRWRSSAPENSTQGTHPLKKCVSLPEREFRAARLSSVLFFDFLLRGAWMESCSLRFCKLPWRVSGVTPWFFTQRRAS